LLFAGQAARRVASGYRDRIFMRKDVILKLAEYGRLNQTRLFNYCGLNSSKHRDILDGLEQKGFISKTVSGEAGSRTTVYSVTPKGLEFCARVLEPYEQMFPRDNNVT